MPEIAWKATWVSSSQQNAAGRGPQNSYSFSGRDRTVIFTYRLHLIVSSMQHLGTGANQCGPSLPPQWDTVGRQRREVSCICGQPVSLGRLRSLVDGLSE